MYPEPLVIRLSYRDELPKGGGRETAVFEAWIFSFRSVFIVTTVLAESGDLIPARFTDLQASMFQNGTLDQRNGKEVVSQRKFGRFAYAVWWVLASVGDDFCHLRQQSRWRWS
jgi:hypothetical protein